MNFQEINTRLKTRDIKGKPYVEVNQRVLAFREVYPTGCIASECVSDDGQRCMFRATIYDGEGKILATGHAFEVRNAGMVNKTSYIENCETSAVGRALGFLGIGITEAIASAEEVENAIAQQGEPEKETQPKDSDAVRQAKQALVDVLRRYAELSGKTYEELVTDEKGNANYRPTQAYIYGRVRHYDALIQEAMGNVE